MRLKLSKYFEAGIVAKIVIPLLLLIILVGGGVTAFKFYDFTENDPKFCVSCHLMKSAFDAWSKSEHVGINCHECHYLSIVDKNKLIMSFVLHRPTKVPPRHGKIIVPWKMCLKCHWEVDKRYPNNPMINNSVMHAKHYFMQKIECSRCHGYRLHQFSPEPRFCLQCHTGKQVHGIGMEQLACLNCHTDRTSDIRPDRDKCLYCHGSDRIRKDVLAQGTLDATFFTPDPETVKKAIKIKLAKDSPMQQFNCYRCHKPHEAAKVLPNKDICLTCHPDAPLVGKHAIHLQMLGGDCMKCHKPHLWRVTAEQAKGPGCTQCHEARDPKNFLR